MSLLLVPVDFSECAPSLLSEAIRFARAFGARLLLLHASETPTGLALNSTVQPPGEASPATVAALLRRDADQHLAPRRRRRGERRAGGVEGGLRAPRGDDPRGRDARGR
ncbi:MAG: universal stress protein [Polyangiales bacterium]